MHWKLLARELLALEVKADDEIQAQAVHDQVTAMVTLVPGTITDLADLPTLVEPEVVSVRRRMAAKLRRIRQTGIAELRGYFKHPAFNGRCEKHARQIGCSCPSRGRKWLAQVITGCIRQHDGFALAIAVLECRQIVRHYYDFSGRKPDASQHENGDRRQARVNDLIHYVQRTWTPGRDEQGRFTHHDTLEVKQTTRTSRTSRLLMMDLQGWDRPTSLPTKSTRLAFCGVCADAPKRKGSPWFRVRRRRLKTGYEQAPFARTAHCPRCGALEETPRPRTSTEIYIATQRFGPVTRLTVFGKTRGLWHTMSEAYYEHGVQVRRRILGERCHVMLHNALNTQRLNALRKDAERERAAQYGSMSTR